jgi:hypothetical protein
MPDPEFDDPLLWLRGTEVSDRLNERNESGQTLLVGVSSKSLKSLLIFVPIGKH